MNTEPTPETAPLAESALGDFSPITRESTAGLIARQLRSAIIEGTLAPGTQLKEMNLAESLGVSRAPIREALQRLLQEGLAENRRQGVFVREMNADDVADIYLARSTCEMAAIDTMLGRQSEDALDRLEQILEVLKQAASDRDRKAISRADREFHEALVDGARSPRLSKMFRTLLAETAICLQALEGSHDDFSHVVDEHHEILAALRARDRQRASRALAAHMEDAVQRLEGEFETTAEA